MTHKRNAEAVRAGRLYLLLLLGTSLVLFLPAIIATWVLAGTLDFTPGGILAGKAGARDHCRCCSRSTCSASARRR